MIRGFVFEGVTYKNRKLVWTRIEDTKDKKALELTFMLEDGEILPDKQAVIKHLSDKGFKILGMVFYPDSVIIPTPQATAGMVGMYPITVKESKTSKEEPKLKHSPSQNDLTTSPSAQRREHFAGHRTATSPELSSSPPSPGVHRLHLFSRHKDPLLEKKNSEDNKKKKDSNLNLSSSSSHSPKIKPVESEVSAEESIVEAPAKIKRYTSIKLSHLLKKDADDGLWRLTGGVDEFGDKSKDKASDVSEQLRSLSAFKNLDQAEESKLLYPKLKQLTEYFSKLYEEVLQPVYHEWRKGKPDILKIELMNHLKEALLKAVANPSSLIRTQWELDSTEGAAAEYDEEDMDTMLCAQAAVSLRNLNFLFIRDKTLSSTETRKLNFSEEKLAKLYVHVMKKQIVLRNQKEMLSEEDESSEYTIEEILDNIETYNRLIDILSSYDEKLKQSITALNPSPGKKITRSKGSDQLSNLSTAILDVKARIKAIALASFKQQVLASLVTQSRHQQLLAEIFKDTKDVLFTRQILAKKKTQLLFKLGYPQQEKIDDFHSFSYWLSTFLNEKLIPKELPLNEIEGIAQEIIKGIINELPKPGISKQFMQIVPERPRVGDHTFYLSTSWKDAVEKVISGISLDSLDKRFRVKKHIEEYVQAVIKATVECFVNASVELVEDKEVQEANVFDMELESTASFSP